jgi:hypothetical protein
MASRRWSAVIRPGRVLAVVVMAGNLVLTKNRVKRIDVLFVVVK